MLEMLFLLLPLASLSGWYIGKKTKSDKNNFSIKKVFSSKYFKGLNYLLDEQPDKAVDVFLQMIEIDDEVIETHLALGNLFRKKGEVGRAIRIHQNLLIRPNLESEYRYIAMLELARDYISSGMLDRAEKLLYDLIEQKQYIKTSYQYLLNIYQQSKDWFKAVKVSEKLHKSGNINNKLVTSQIYCEIAEELSYDDNKLIDYLNKAIKIYPKCSRAYVQFAIYYKNKRDFEQSLNYYMDALSHNKDLIQSILPQIEMCLMELSRIDDIPEFIANYLQYCATTDVILIIAKWLYSSKHIVNKEAVYNILLEYAKNNISLPIGVTMLSLANKLSLKNFAIESFFNSDSQIIPNYKCANCGLTSSTFHWHCPSCQQWESQTLLVE